MQRGKRTCFSDLREQKLLADRLALLADRAGLLVRVVRGRIHPFFFSRKSRQHRGPHHALKLCESPGSFAGYGNKGDASH